MVVPKICGYKCFYIACWAGQEDFMYIFKVLLSRNFDFSCHGRLKLMFLRAAYKRALLGSQYLSYFPLFDDVRSRLKTLVFWALTDAVLNSYLPLVIAYTVLSE